MKTSSLVSVIIPIYNVKKYLYRCLNSVTNQTYRNLEIILIDDGSTDGSSNICDEFLCDKRVIVRHKRNQGVSNARYDGYNISTGDYIFYVDADDYLEPHAIYVLVSEATKTNADIVISGYNHVINGKATPFIRIQNGLLGKKDIDNLLSNYFLFDKRNNPPSTALPIALWGKLYKRKCLGNTLKDGFGIKYGEDLVILYSTLKQIDSLLIINNCLYNYVIQDVKPKRDLKVMLDDSIIVWQYLKNKDEEKYFSNQLPSMVCRFCLRNLKKSTQYDGSYSLFCRKHNLLRNNKQVVDFLFSPYKFHPELREDRVFLFLFKHNQRFLIYLIYKILTVLKIIYEKRIISLFSFFKKEKRR